MKKRINFKKIVKYIPIFIASIIITLTFYLRKSIYNMSFDQALYSIMKTSGTSVNAISDGFIYTMIGTFIIFGILMIPFYPFKRSIYLNVNIKDKKKRIKLFNVKNIKRYNIILIVISILFIAYGAGLFEYIYYNSFKTKIYDSYYVDARSVNIDFPEEKQNLIYIFLESTENTNLSLSNGGIMDDSIMPNMEEIALNNINFSNSEKLGGAMESYGTSWTASAMIAQTSGFPFRVSLNDFKSDSTELNNLYTLGDILYDNGYDNYLFMGSIKEFGGRSEYFSSHHYNIYDYNKMISDGKLESDYYEWWGYEDSKLYSFAKSKLLELSNSDKPFNLTLLTADTHFTDGYVDKSCTSKFDKKYANSFYCEDSMLNDFINWVKEQDFYSNTTIILQGDHPTMQNNFYDGISSYYVRTTYNAIINSRSFYVNNKNRVFTTMDMFPTTIASLGASIEGNRLGLGTNLFSSEKTIPEEMGIDKFNTELRKYSKTYNEIRFKNN